MVQKFLNSIDLLKTELRNARVHNLAGAPSNPVEGQIYQNTTTHVMYFWGSDAWYPMTGIQWVGSYVGTRTYVKNEAVNYQGSTFVKTSAAAAGTVPAQGADWDILAQGGMLATYTNSTPMPVAVGGLKSGTTFNAVTQQSLWDRLLYPFQAPGFASFAMTGQASTLEVGAGISGSKTFTWSTSNSGNVTPGSVIIQQDGVTIASGLNASGSTTVTIPAITNNAPATHTWTIRGTDVEGTQFSTSFSVTWQFKKFYGTSPNQSLTSADIQALANNSLASTAAGNYAFGPGDYKYFAVPVAFTAPSSIKDQSTLLSVTMADNGDGYTQTANGINYAQVALTNAQGVTANYRVYRSKSKLAAPNGITFVVA